jgi:hypothetical protein
VLSLELFPGAELRLDDLVLTPTTAVALLVSTAPTATCPQCGTACDRVHSRFRRTVADLPSQGRVVVLRLLVGSCWTTQVQVTGVGQENPQNIASASRSSGRRGQMALPKVTAAECQRMAKEKPPAKKSRLGHRFAFPSWKQQESAPQP